MKKKLGVVLALFALMALLAATVPASAATVGEGASVTGVSPNLKGIKDANGNYPKDGSGNLTTGFPCQGGGNPDGGDAISYFATHAQNAQDGTPKYGCDGDIYGHLLSASGPGNTANFSGSGVDSGSGRAFSVHGTGSISGSYTYSEPCQVVGPAGKQSGTGEAQGTLTISLTTGGGVVNNIPFVASGVSPIKIAVHFWWSRVGVTAVVGIRGANVTAGSQTANDPDATGLAGALFVPTESPNCNDANHPAEGSINIFSGTLSEG
ncbi:MAG: hypothetical protein ABR507_01120 [Actinomycetota bacterium]|nr:hypothetical protein [Actinomycetota bacterium]